MANKTINDVRINVKFDEYDNHIDNLVSKESLQISLGKIQKWKTDFHPVVWTGDADTVNNHTVLTDVPADAVFTDTTYVAGNDISIDYVNTSPDLTLFTWSQGSISDTTGYEDDTVENVIRLDGFLPIPNETPINVSLTYQQTIPLYWKMFFYDDNQTMLGHTEWMTNEDGVNPVANASYFRLIAYQGTSDSLDSRLLTYGEISPEVDVDKYVISNTYELPIASADTLGGVKVGEDLVIDENGVLNIADIHRLILNVTE